MKVTLFKAFPDPYRKSMGVYAERLMEALRTVMVPTHAVTAYLPRRALLAPRVARYWSQYVRYQLQAPLAQGDVNHVVDHAYGHLLHTLDSRRTVVTFHDAIWLWFRKGTLRNSGDCKALTMVQRYNLSGLCKAAVVICVSESSRKDFLRYAKYPAEKTAVVYPGVDTVFFEQKDNAPADAVNLPAGRYLLHVGHARFYKNIPALFHALAILVRSFGYDVRLLKVGEAFNPEQEKVIDGLGIRDRVIHLGMVEDERLPGIYRCADALLLPSWHEGFGFPVLEAMASGVPVVASNRGSLPEVVGDAGILVDPDDYETMAKSIVAILDRPQLREELREAGIKRARLFTWQKTAEKTLDVYRRVYQAGRR